MLWRVVTHDSMAVSPADVAAWSWCELWECHAVLDAIDAMRRQATEDPKKHG